MPAALARRKPGVLLPEGLERGVGPSENVAFGFAKVRDADRVHGARAQTAMAVAGILPEVPAAPR